LLTGRKPETPTLPGAAHGKAGKVRKVGRKHVMLRMLGSRAKRVGVNSLTPCGLMERRAISCDMADMVTVPINLVYNTRECLIRSAIGATLYGTSAATIIGWAWMAMWLIGIAWEIR
jgi:hypothetical protein